MSTSRRTEPSTPAATGAVRSRTVVVLTAARRGHRSDGRAVDERRPRSAGAAQQPAMARPELALERLAGHADWQVVAAGRHDQGAEAGQAGRLQAAVAPAQQLLRVRVRAAGPPVG